MASTGEDKRVLSPFCFVHFGQSSPKQKPTRLNTGLVSEFLSFFLSFPIYIFLLKRKKRKKKNSLWKWPGKEEELYFYLWRQGLNGLLRPGCSKNSFIIFFFCIFRSAIIGVCLLRTSYTRQHLSLPPSLPSLSHQVSIRPGN